MYKTLRRWLFFIYIYIYKANNYFIDPEWSEECIDFIIFMFVILYFLSVHKISTRDALESSFFKSCDNIIMSWMFG